MMVQKDERALKNEDTMMVPLCIETKGKKYVRSLKFRICIRKMDGEGRFRQFCNEENERLFWEHNRGNGNPVWTWEAGPDGDEDINADGKNDISPEIALARKEERRMLRHDKSQEERRLKIVRGHECKERETTRRKERERYVKAMEKERPTDSSDNDAEASKDANEAQDKMEEAWGLIEKSLAKEKEGQSNFSSSMMFATRFPEGQNQENGGLGKTGTSAGKSWQEIQGDIQEERETKRFQ